MIARRFGFLCYMFEMMFSFCFRGVTGTGYWYEGFEYRLILSMFYVWFRVSVDTQYVLCVVSRYRLILHKFYVTFQDYQLGVFIVIVYKALVCPTSVFKALLFSGIRESGLRQTEFFNILG